MFYKKQVLITLREHMGSPLVSWMGTCWVTHRFRFLCCVVFFALFVFILCLVYPMLPVSLNCSFLIAFRFSLTFIWNIFVKEHVRLLLCIFKKKEIIKEPMDKHRFTIPNGQEYIDEVKLNIKFDTEQQEICKKIRCTKLVKIIRSYNNHDTF